MQLILKANFPRFVVYEIELRQVIRQLIESGYFNECHQFTQQPPPEPQLKNAHPALQRAACLAKIGRCTMSTPTLNSELKTRRVIATQ